MPDKEPIQYIGTLCAQFPAFGRSGFLETLKDQILNNVFVTEAQCIRNQKIKCENAA